MARARTKLSLSVGELARIKRRLHYVRDPERKKRLQVVCRAAEGQYTLAQLAGMAGCARSSIQLWLDLFRKGGVEGLLMRKSPPGQTSPMARPGVKAQLEAGLKAGRWRDAAELKNWLSEVHKIDSTKNSVKRRLRAMGLGLCRAEPTSFKGTRATADKRASRKLAHQSDPAILGYDGGGQAAADIIRTMSRSEEWAQIPPIEVWLQSFFELLETGECSLEEANRFLTEVKKEWQREERSE